MTTASCIAWFLMGLLVGFAPGCSNSRPSIGLFIGLLFGVFFGGVLYMFDAHPVLAALMAVGSTLGGVVAAIVPASNPIKRYFDLARD